MAFVQPRLRLTTAAPFSSAYSSAVSTRDAFDILLSSYTRSTITSTASGVRSATSPAVAVPWPLMSVTSAVALAKS